MICSSIAIVFTHENAAAYAAVFLIKIEKDRVVVVVVVFVTAANNDW